MQTLTSPASVTKRKQACSSCRHRKKRCDGQRPSCSLCLKWGIHCEYGVPASSGVSDGFPVIPMPFFQSFFPPSDFALLAGTDGSLEYGPLAGIDANLPGTTSTSSDRDVPGYPTPVSASPGAAAANTVTELDESLMANVGLPPDETLIELVGQFFEHYRHVFPCFHMPNLMQELYTRKLQTESPLLLYAICAMCARRHWDESIKSRQSTWYALAKFEYDISSRNPVGALRTLQAALCIMTHAYTIGDFSAGWLYLGKAWRQACALGLNRIDSDHDRFFGIEKQAMHTHLEEEEYRRTLWVLFMADRIHSWPTGWPHGLDERQFKVDIPVAEEVFSSWDSDTSASTATATPTSFTRSLSSLIVSTSKASSPLNVFHYLAVAHVLLGRVTEQVNSLHEAPNSAEYAEECDELDSHIMRFRLSLPRTVASVLECPLESRGEVAWLHCTLNTTSIILHFRCLRFLDEEQANAQFGRALAAARNTAQLIKDASRVSIDCLLSAHVGSSLYISACILVIQHRLTGEDSLRADIDLFSLLFDRYNEVFTFMGLKYKLALEHDLGRDEENIKDLRARGFRGMLTDCSKWVFVKDFLEKHNIEITIS